MKRNFPENSTRTPGCLPVPLFNQRKRTRQPLTSNPLQNDLSTNNSTADNFDFSSMLAVDIPDPCVTGKNISSAQEISVISNMLEKATMPNSARINYYFGWETTTLEPTRSQKTTGIAHENTSKPTTTVTQAGRKVNNWRLEDDDFSATTWKRNDFPAFGRGTGNRPSLQHENRSDFWKGSGPTQPKLAGNRQAPQQSSNKAGVMEKTKSSTPTMLRGPQQQSVSYSFKHNPCQQKVHEKTDHPTSDDKIIQKGPVHHARLKEKDNSLRILSAVIESMKHWSQYAEKIPLLFEVLGVLDSAVTPGPYGAKTFLLRDGKESVSCVFYEIDRDLPRLIRGRVHRCMGNYDAKRKVFRCVSVRPATANEEQTFQDFVRVADIEMGKYVKTSNEV